MNRALALMLLAASGCSVIFDPSKVAPALSCTDTAAPEELGALAGEAPDQLTWSWTAKVAGKHRLCTSVPGAQSVCTDVECEVGPCAFVQTGLAANVRVTGAVGIVSACDGGVIGSASSAASAIDTTQSDAGWVLDTANCNLAEGRAIAGDISLQLTNCTAAFVTGDEGWGDLTLTAEVRHSPGNSGVAAGVGIAANSQGHRIGFLSEQDRLFLYAPSNISKRFNGNDTFVSEAVEFALTDWQAVKIIRRGKTLSWSQAPIGQPLTERLRWNDRDAPTGRFGIGGAGSGRFEMRNLRVSSRPEPFPDAEESVSWFPGNDGGLPRVRRFGNPAGLGPCPSFPPACSNGCAPPAGASCAEFATSGIFTPAELLPAPRGLDPARDWEATVRFALQADAGVGNNVVLAARNNVMLEFSRVVTQVAGQPVSPLLRLDDATWHVATIRFPPDGGNITAVIDGTPYLSTTKWPPADGSRSIDSLRLGSSLNPNTLYVHELTVRMP